MADKKDRMKRGSRLTQPREDDVIKLEEAEFKQSFTKNTVTPADQATQALMLRLLYPALLGVVAYRWATHTLDQPMPYRSLIFLGLLLHFGLHYLFLYRNSGYYRMQGAEGWGWILFFVDLGLLYFYGKAAFALIAPEAQEGITISRILAPWLVKIHLLLIVWEIARAEVVGYALSPDRGLCSRVRKSPYSTFSIVGFILFMATKSWPFGFAVIFAGLLLFYLSLVVRDLQQKLVLH